MPRGRKDNKGESGQMDSLYTSDDFRMYCFKVLPCSKHYCHDWTECPFAHNGEKARRRDPRLFPHMGIECPQLKEESGCPRGEMCPFAHNVFECWLHPTRYRTQLCNEPASCRRKVCFFAHTVDELREASSGVEHDPPPVPAPGSDSASAASLPQSGTPDHQMVSSDVDTGVPPMPTRNTRSALEMASKKKTKKGGYHDSASSGHSRRSSIESCPSRPRDRSSAELPRNKNRGTASCDGRPTRSKQTRDNSRHSVDIARLSRQRQMQEKDSASATAAHLQSLRNEMMARQLGFSPNDLTNALEQISLASNSQNQSVPLQGLQSLQSLQTLQALQPQLQSMMNVQDLGSLLTPGMPQNDRVVQILMMLLKELSDGQGAQPMRPSSDFHNPRSSLESSFSVGSGVPGRTSMGSDRISLDSLANGQFPVLPGNGLQDPRGFYYPAHANQVGVDGVPDFILHDSQQRGPSLDSTLSDSLHLHNASSYSRVSTESAYEPSLVSRGSIDQPNLSLDGGLTSTGMPPQMHPSNYMDLLAQNGSGVDTFNSVPYTGSAPDLLSNMKQNHRT